MLDHPVSGLEFPFLSLFFPLAQQGDNTVHNGYRDDNDSDKWSICVFHMANL
jgi:hypothetical protein